MTPPETASVAPPVPAEAAVPLPGRLVEYLALPDRHPRWFRNPPGGVEILLDPGAILEVECEIGARYAARGLPAAWAEVGIHYRDPYLVLLRDAVRFPGGDVGVHHRVLRGEAEPAGVAVMPRLPDGRIVLLRHFRHATRDWHWEVPRGGIEPGADEDATARTEMAEEIGAVVGRLTPIGAAHGSTGLLGVSVRLFLAEVEAVGSPDRNEGITELRAVGVRELEDMIRAGEVTDGFTLACVLNARLRGLV